MSGAEAAADLATELRETGIALLRNAFATDSLTRLRAAASRCFEAVEADRSLAERIGFNRFSHSVPLAALLECGCDAEELTAPLSAPGLDTLFLEALGSTWTCRLEHSWVRKKFAQAHKPHTQYHAQGWHQDGALGVRFPQQPDPSLPMTNLLTCWIPLQACGVDSPSLEFIRKTHDALLHFTELDDTALRQRFASEQFCAPELHFGDGAIFLNSVLHRTYMNETMRCERLSMEYRIFPR